MIEKVRKNQIVEIVFQDHSEGGDSLEFIVYGRVMWQTPKDITVGCWVYSEPCRKVKLDDYNVHLYTIVKKAIRSIRRLQ